MKPVPFPQVSDLRRIHALVEVPAEMRGANLARTAHHEAGHIVLMRWAGLDPTHATAAETGGRAHWTPWDGGEEVQQPDEANRPLYAAWLAAVWHAGIVAELLHAGLTWEGVLYRPRSQDWKTARQFLAPHFGIGLAGHGFAQRTALAVLTEHWPEVQKIAAELIEHGEWRPTDD